MGARMRNPVVAHEPMNRRLLAIYLNDHMAASTGAVELVRRVAASNRGTSHGEMLAELKTEIEQDRAALASIASGRRGYPRRSSSASACGPGDSASDWSATGSRRRPRRSVRPSRQPPAPDDSPYRTAAR
jgi:hypothetical protein